MDWGSVTIMLRQQGKGRFECETWVSLDSSVGACCRRRRRGHCALWN